MSKILITSGCSFSECISPNLQTWPIHLYDILKSYGFSDHISTAMGSQGNGLISRGIIYSVTQALKNYKPENILVGVMWSGSNRLDYRCQNSNLLSFKGQNIDGWIENPTQFVKHATKNWVIMNYTWKNEEATIYYKYFHDFVGCAIYTLEHILRTQLFLKSKNINYFFTNFIDDYITDKITYESHLYELEYLFDELDYSNYLPVTSEYKWVLDNASDKEEFLKQHFIDESTTAQWLHPSSSQHKEFTENVIYPFLKSKNII